MCRNQLSEPDIKDSEVAVDQPANENAHHPAEIYTRNTGHAVVDRIYLQTGSGA